VTQRKARPGKLKLTLACWDYDRTRALADGSVAPEGIELVYLPLFVEETFFRMVRHREFDCAEMSLSSYVVSLGLKDRPFVAIPVFPSRCFRHSFIFVSAKSGIARPEQLAGRRVGNPEYQLTAPVWIRGILADEHGIAPDSPEYFLGGEEEPGRTEKLSLDLPARFRVRRIGARQTLAQMLAEGEIDALYSPRTPSTMHTRPKAVRRLFEDYVEVERAYFRRTKIFPIMHTVVIRREVYERNRWCAQALMKAFAAAQRKVYADFAETAALKVMLPWVTAHVEEARRELGEDWWAYGFAPNRHVLETFLRYHHEQGLSKRRYAPEELFVPESFETFKI
jgi:4,5-dihydroxyphthalate decarboxylase